MGCIFSFHKDEHETKYSAGGQFLPLSVWGNQGFDIDMIKSTTPKEDIKWNNQLGWCYRVVIQSQEETRKKSTRECLVIANQKRRRIAPSIEGSPKAKAKATPSAIAPLTGSSDSGTSSDDSSSSSDSEPAAADAEEEGATVHIEETRQARLQRERNEAKESKAVAKAKAKATATQQKAVEALKKKAALLRKRLVLTLNALRHCVTHPNILDVPTTLSQEVQSYIHAFQRMVNECDQITSGVTTTWPTILDEIPYKEAKSVETLLKKMLNTVAKVRSIQM